MSLVSLSQLPAKYCTLNTTKTHPYPPLACHDYTIPPLPPPFQGSYINSFRRRPLSHLIWSASNLIWFLRRWSAMSGELSLLVVHPLNSRTSGRNSFNRIESLVRNTTSTCNFGIRILVSTSTEFSRIGFSCPQRQPLLPTRIETPIKQYVM